MSIPVSQLITPPLLSWCSYVCSLCLWLYFCFVHKIVYTSFFRFYIYLLIYDICFSISDILLSVWQSLGPSNLHKWPSFVLYYGWIISYCIYVCVSIYIYIYHIFFIHSSVIGYLGCLQILTITNSASVNTGVHVSFWIVVFSCYMPSSRIAGLHVSITDLVHSSISYLTVAIVH